MVLDSRVCNSTNTLAVDQSSFWSNGSVNWDAHRIGWVVAGSFAVATVLVTAFSVTMHTLYYNSKMQQRQIIRILLMPPVYAVISFFSYRYFRSYTYFSVTESIYEAIAVAAFLYLLVGYIGETPAEQRAVLNAKDKRKVPIPFCCWRYRPSKPYFLNLLKFSVLQYCFMRPIITIIAIICDATGKLCPEQYSVYFAEVYLDAFDFVVFSVALYGLIVFYAVTRDQLKGKSPLAKFLTIKGIVFITFYQGFVFDILQKKGAIKGTEFWTPTNVAEGLQALATTIEMFLFAILMCFTFSWKPYKQMATTRTPSFRSFLHAMNFSDFILDTFRSIKFYIDYARNKPGTRSSHFKGPLDFNAAFDGPDNPKGAYDSPRESRPDSMDVQRPGQQGGAGRYSAGEKTPQWRRTDGAGQQQPDMQALPQSQPVSQPGGYRGGAGRYDQ